MAKKKPDPVLSLTGNFEHVTAELASRTRKLGGSLSGAMVELSQSGHDGELDELAGVLARVSKTVTLSAEAPRPAIIQPQTIIPVRFKVDWDETLEAKVKRGKRKTIAWATGIADDQHYPFLMSGKAEVEGTMVHFGRFMPQEAIEVYAASVGQEVAHPKALVDLMLQNPRPALDGQMPLAAPFFWTLPDGPRCALCARRGFGGRGLDSVWLGPRGDWSGGWWFLLLRK